MPGPLPPVAGLFPATDSKWSFWGRYLFSFLLMLPGAVVSQISRVLSQANEAFSTSCRAFHFLEQNRLTVKFLGYGRLCQTSAVFGWRFLIIKYGDVLIDPGPKRAWPEVERFLRSLPRGSISMVLCTHYHEEHIGNAASAAKLLSVPIYGTRRTIEEIRNPSIIPFYRSRYFGQPNPCDGDVELRELPDRIETKDGPLIVIPASGHCEDHVAFYCPLNKILFSGDSFMEVLLTYPNAEVNASRWIATLERYRELDVDMVLEGHGELHTISPKIPAVRGLVVRESPQAIFEQKLAFLRWAMDAVEYGRQQRMDSKLIEACLFQPVLPWSRTTWFRDESFRFYSFGEFSRSQFVRSFMTNESQLPAEAASFGTATAELELTHK
jgi:hydroxyacylglutathione hydrolase